MSRSNRLLPCLAWAAAAALSSSAADAAPITFLAAGDLATVQSEVDAFRASVGDPNNGNAPGPLPTGRREINWDGGGSNLISAVPTPFIGFEDSRGGTFTTPGTGFVQSPFDQLDDAFLEPSYDGEFAAFSPLRLFVPVGSNVTEATFSIPGTAGATAAGVGAFGAVFNDVDLDDSTSIAFYDAFGNLIDTLFAPVGVFSFVGMQLDPGDLISRVLITTGTAALGTGIVDSSSVDVVVMDDFLYQEPQILQDQNVVPEPATLVLTGMGLLAAGWRPRRRRQ